MENERKRNLVKSEWVADLVNFNKACSEWSYHGERCSACPSERRDRCPEANRTTQRSMFKVQAEGAARTWNNLEEKGISLLADEVGMGKTIQALSVVSILWRIKPFARVLVVAPNRQVAENWITEYSNFIQSHYRCVDDVVKTKNDQQAVNPLIYCDNLFDFVNKIKRQQWGRFHIIKTSSFSHILNSRAERESAGITSGLARIKDNSGKAKVIGERLRRQVLKYCGGFDLIIIDEAHYFRNSGSNSLRVNTAKGFFGTDGREKKLAGKVLLMTATPNHSTEKDINNIVKYFTDKYGDTMPSHEILRDICLRRFRLLGGKNKYEYRNEQAIPAQFSPTEPLSEMFFALYQKKLIREKANSQGRRFLFGYLEGNEIVPAIKKLPLTISDSEFRSLCQTPELKISTYYEKNALTGEYYLKERESSDKKAEQNRIMTIQEALIEYHKKVRKEADSEVDDDESESKGTDFYKTIDSEILLEIALKYFKIFNKAPEHPKYDLMTETLAPGAEAYWQGKAEKHLVFVRRIPSVYELSARVMERYDDLLWRKIERTLLDIFKELPTPDHRIPGREDFSDWMTKQVKGQEEDENREAAGADAADEAAKNDDLTSRTRSKVLDLFITRSKAKNRKSRATHASQLRNRFVKPTSIFSLFFQPGDRYTDNPYNQLQKLSYKRNNDNIIDYVCSVGQQRLADIGQEKQLIESRYRKDAEIISRESIEGPFHTLFTIVGKVWKKTDEGAYKKLQEYTPRPSDYEALADFIKTGILFASGAVVELYCWFVRAEAEAAAGQEGIELYKRYCELVSSEIEGSLLEAKVKEAVLHFDNYCQKTIGAFKENEILSNRIYKDLYNLTPVQPMCGDIDNRVKYIHAFNSPFFPDIIIATSVLQEGVNLNYFCKNVHHYGIAFTTGDNEQRVGRVDRMFGLIDREITRGQDPVTKQGYLSISYPYLAQSFDEDQLGIYLRRKYQNESKLDKCILLQEGKEVKIEQLERGDWKIVLNNVSNPRQDMLGLKDPYEGSEACEIVHDRSLLVPADHSTSHSAFIKKITEKVRKVIKGYRNCTIFDGESSSNLGNCLLRVDVNLGGSRKQPVDIDFKYSPHISGMKGETIYCLSFSTPLSNDVKKVIEILENKWPAALISNYPMVRICLDPDAHEQSLRKVYAAVDLPVFRFDKEDAFLQEQEILYAFRSLVEGTDYFERKYLHSQDIRWENYTGFTLIQESGVQSNEAIARLGKEFTTIRSKTLSISVDTDEILRLNHLYPIVVREKRSPRRPTVRISYPKHNVQAEERKLLSQLFDAAIQSINEPVE